MNSRILDSEVQQFLTENANTDVIPLLLKKPFFEHVSNKELAQQLEARKKCEKKLPTWFGTPQIYYPDKLNIEQTSSEVTARYKASIITGKTLLDATGGFGVDSYFFSERLGQVVHCEINENLSRITAHNFKVLGVGNIDCIPTDGIEYLKNSKRQFDWIYLDPSRRNDIKGKVFRLSDCQPNVLNELDLLFAHANNILLKTSPLLDFSIGMEELRFVKEIHVVAVKNEVKELLWILEKDYLGEIKIATNNFSKSGNQEFSFLLSEEKKAVSNYSSPLSYLYEPNAAILKSGAFKIIGNRSHIKKLHQHTHLYTSEKLIGFPGRRFKINKVMTYSKSNMKRLNIKKANISARNFPESVSRIRKKFQIEDGGLHYFFFVIDTNDNMILLNCSKI